MVGISELHIENFRTIKSVDIKFNRDLNAFIGRNNAGKSNILRPIQILLDEKWPQYAITEEDLPNENKDAECKIEICFDSALPYNYYGTQYEVKGLSLKFNRKDGSGPLTALDTSKTIITSKWNTPIRVSNDFRDIIPMIHIGIDRSFQQHLLQEGWNSWNGLLFRISSELAKKIESSTEKKGKFEESMSELMDVINTEDLLSIKDKISEETKRLTGADDIEINFKEPDIKYFYKNLSIHIKERGFEPNAALLMGTGFQSGLIVALSKVYKNLSNDTPILLIEEPEIYLHPQARKFFYSALKEIANEGIQVIYTTHSSEFISLNTPNTINIVRKNAQDGTKTFQGLNHTWTENEEIKLYSRFNSDKNELFFADKVLLVEGPTEKKAMPFVFQLNGIDVNKSNISIIDCDGAEGIEFFANTLKIFGIPFVIMADKDPKNKEPGHIKNRNEILSRITETIFLDPDFEGVLKIKQTERSKVSSAIKHIESMRSEDIPPVMNTIIDRVANLN